MPPPPLACGFKAGDQALRHGRTRLGEERALQVQYFSETKQRWVETLVLRMFELEGNICYDLDCKKGVSADKASRCAVCIYGGVRPWQVRSSPRASQERYEVPCCAMQENARRRGPERIGRRAVAPVGGRRASGVLERLGGPVAACKGRAPTCQHMQREVIKCRLHLSLPVG